MTNIVQSIVGALAVLAVIAAVAVLCWHGRITGEAAVAIFSAVLGGGITAGAQHAGVRAGARAANNKEVK